MYRVAFVYTQYAGGYEGVVTWTTWLTKEDFEADKANWSEEKKLKERVFEEGISEERCVELVNQTPAACRIAAAFAEATIDGKVNPFILEMQLANAVFMNANRG